MCVWQNCFVFSEMSWKEWRLIKRENGVLRQTECTNWSTERKSGKWLLKLSVTLQAFRLYLD